MSVFLGSFMTIWSPDTDHEIWRRASCISRYCPKMMRHEMSVGPHDPDYIIWYHVLLLLWFSPVMWCCFQIISSHNHRLIIWWPYISKNILHLMTSLDLCSTSFYHQLAMSSKGPPPGPGQDLSKGAGTGSDEQWRGSGGWCHLVLISEG